ncbi:MULTISPECIES: flagellar hook protein FlgL [Rhodopseudomonas]|uniref:Flagellar hook protein FlgL n=1 Tax=Rhodopseudomonas palustris TaxID=1076 RepID=A0A0D7EHE6_RHOPL|nr:MULTISPECIES: flagellar hook protein FlgL [Rhodopseudomonas]KIZ38952.1 flagellar hook protein FlgL [Rhodopseudomonas palustris]MDF3811811.1 flagellar biosynthesis protein FlgL [Rhodopseudomonas sp. BAL398]WOK20281.1 flagellar biosynthesis protein FlgL [Rhodopseudomonas sp. BAL398]
MAIDGVSGRTSYIGSGILNLRSQLDSLSEQLASGRISNTYAGQGSGRSLALGIRAQLNSYSAYTDTATNVTTRINVANLSLQRLVTINSDVKGAAVSAGNTLDNTGQTAGQKTANLDFYDSVDMLNAQSGDRYLFGGRITDTAPVAAADQILNGNGAAIAGLKQVIAERGQADIGTAPNWGRVIVSAPSPTAVQIGEDFAADPNAAPPVAASPFGLKLSSISTTIAGVVPTQPTETPPTVPPAAANPQAMSIDIGATNPTDGDKVNFTFDLPDGTKETITLTASSAVPTPANGFAIDPGDPQAVPPVLPSSTVTAANLKSALSEAVKQLANGPLAAASAVRAGQDFFDDPPQRVGGAPNFSTATTLVNGTAADTVIWYTGEKEAPPPAPADPARGTAVARIDDGTTVRYGARANEQALRTQLQNVAVFAAVTTKVTDVNASGKVAALGQRIAQNLAVIPGTQTIQDIQADFAGAQASIKSTADRQSQGKLISQTLLDSIEGINSDEVATKILALQTALQASYQTTSKMYQMSLVKFL